MEQLFVMNLKNILYIAGALSAFSLAAGCSSDTTVGSTPAALTASCIATEDAENLPEDEWLCTRPFPVECEDGGADPDTIYFHPMGDLEDHDCGEITVGLKDEVDMPFPLGTHQVVVLAEANEGDPPPTAMCEGTLIVQDTEPPKENDEPTELWPPNHKFHTITAEDCVTDACGGDVQITFLSASSDEPVNDKGDGNTEPDIILGCDSVELRAERQGGSDGRVYTLEYRAVDDEGNETETPGTCTVVVPHDQSGDEAVAQEPAYTVKQENDCDDGTGGTGGNGGEGGGEGGMGGEGGSEVP